MKLIVKTTLFLLGTSVATHAQVKADSIKKTNEGSDKRTSYYVEAGSYGTKRESDPPAYVRNLSKSGITGAEKITWLDLGLDHRSRLEYRKNDIRRDTLVTDLPLMLKTKLYLGIKNLVDPFRAVVEVQDSRRVNGIFPEDDRDFNRMELIQAYGELYFKKAFGQDKLGNNRPFSIRFGRQAFEFLDRRLIGSNQWRNTTNNFIGFRASLGEDKNDWHIDLLALRPIKRLVNDFDITDFDRQFGAVIGHWRKWSKVVTVEPYYMGLKQSASLATGYRARIIHNPGLRLSGWLFKGSFNYDFAANLQFGDDNGSKQQAQMYTAEIGYKINALKSKPRFSFFYGYVSGDKDPNDKISNRYERFYGFARPWSSDDYIIPENVVTPKLKVEFEPVKGLKVDGGYSFYWLASSTDRFNNLLAGSSYNRDKSGASGNELGHGLDCRIRFQPVKFLDVNIGYTHYTNGHFVTERQMAMLGSSAKSSDFAYLELTFNVVDLFKKSNKVKKEDSKEIKKP